MQLKTIVATALLPLLAVADDSTLTSTMTMTKYITISRVATSSVYANATASYHHYPTATGYSSVLTTTTAESGSSSTISSPTVSPTIDNGNNAGNGAGSLSAFGFAGVVGMVLAALM
ncbi:hypothetical protein F5Y14DRAFT_453368 [Nemania sp. NC0429]|nr:hypothetical protein F5Y14DRAFT_453368 [Nemania sp. NC0429]